MPMIGSSGLFAMVISDSSANFLGTVWISLGSGVFVWSDRSRVAEGTSGGASIGPTMSTFVVLGAGSRFGQDMAVAKCFSCNCYDGHVFSSSVLARRYPLIP